MRVAALDIGGTKLAAAIVEEGRVRWRAQADMPPERPPERALELAQNLLKGAGSFERLGVAMTGRIINGKTHPLNTDTLPNWEGFPLQDRLQERLNLPVVVLNDARAATYGEARYGAGRGRSEFMFITVSTGIGAGFMLGNRLHLAANGLEAELGFTLTRSSLNEVMTIRVPSYRLPEAVPVRPLEFEASGTALNLYAQAWGFANAKALADAAEGGHDRAAGAYESGISALAHKIADLAVLLGISRVALGGSVGLRKGYLRRVREALKALPPLYRPDIVHAELGADAGLVGAAAYARNTLAPQEAP